MANPKIEGTPAVLAQAGDEREFSERRRIACGLQMASRAMSSALNKAVSPFGLSGMEAKFLLQVGEGFISPTETATCLAIDPSSLSRILRKLEKERLVKRKVDPDNLSRVQISLTSKGKERAGDVRPLVNSAEKEVLKTLDDSELIKLRELLQKVCMSVMSS